MKISNLENFPLYGISSKFYGSPPFPLNTLQDHNGTSLKCPNITQLDPQQPSQAETVGISHLLSAGVEPSCGAAVMAVVAKKAVEEVTVGSGLPGIPTRLHKKMLAWEYIDLDELPSARAMPKEPSLTIRGIYGWPSRQT